MIISIVTPTVTGKKVHQGKSDLTSWDLSVIAAEAKRMQTAITIQTFL